MQLILRDDVEHLGKRGDIVEVAKGYARNYLLPRNLAMEVNDNNLRRIKKEAKVAEAKAAREKEEAEAQAARLGSLRLPFARKVHEGDDLYGSVSVGDIVEALEARGQPVEKRRVLLPEPIRKLGTYTVSLRLHPEVTVPIEVVVEKEGE
jgi:large subunit ribosomal protein L9